MWVCRHFNTLGNLNIMSNDQELSVLIGCPQAGIVSQVTSCFNFSLFIYIVIMAKSIDQPSHRCKGLWYKRVRIFVILSRFEIISFTHYFKMVVVFDLILFSSQRDKGLVLTKF